MALGLFIYYNNIIAVKAETFKDFLYMNSPMHALAGAITEKFIEAAPEAAARALSAMATHEAILLLSPLKAQLVVSCLDPMAPAKAAAILRRLPLRQASYVLARLSVPQAARLMQEFSGPYRERISGVLEPAFVKLLADVSAYAPGSVGALMRTDFVAVRTETKLSQLVERLKNLPRKKLPSVCWVTDKDGVLKGLIRSAELAFYAPQSAAGSVMSEAEFISPAQTADSARKTFESAGTDMLAVVNEKNVLVGVLPLSAVPVPMPEEKKSFWRKLAD